VEEGRAVYDNIKKSILFILPTNGAQALIIIVAIFMGLSLPITPVQILWVNMVTAVTLALVLAFETPELDVMRRPPRPTREPLLPPFFLWRIAFVSVIITIGPLLLFLWKSGMGLPEEQARAAAINALIVGQVFYLFNSRYIRATSVRSDILTANPYALYAVAVILFAQLLFTYAPFMQRTFGTAGVSLSAWPLIVLAGAIVFPLVELEKAILRRRDATLRPTPAVAAERLREARRGISQKPE
jgi:magnesium-transporting ATPase (P-type)